MIRLGDAIKTRMRSTAPRLLPLRNTAFLLFVLVYLLAIPVARAGDLDTVVHFDISAQTLDTALLQLGAQAHIQIMFASSSQTSSRRTATLKGDYTARQALTILLTGTQMTFSHHGNSVEIAPSTANSATKSSSSASKPLRTPSTIHPTTLRPANTTQTDDPPRPLQRRMLNEVLVTAQKREQRAFDVPISLDVLTSTDLELNKVAALSDLQYYVPGLFVESGGPQRRITINGVSNVFGSGSLVGIYMDDADETPDGFVGNYGYGQLDSRTYDMARVEVLRGPQGTLYGEGSMGGTIHFVTNKPVLDRFEMSSDVSGELTQDGAPSQRVDMMLNAPLLQNSLGLRFAGEFEHEGGWIDEPAATVQNFNDQNLVDVRIEALWRPASNLTVNLTQVEHRNAYGIDDGEDANGNYTQYFSQTTTPHGKQSYNLTNATIIYDFTGAQLLSSTTYFNVENHNIDWGELIPIGGTGFQVYEPSYPTEEKNISEELRLSRTGPSAWQWTVGYFYKHFTDGAAYSYYFDAPQPPGTPLSTLPFYPYSAGDRDEASAAFADTSYRLFDRLILGIGARYFRNNVHYTVTGSPVQTGTFSSTDPRFYVRYGLTDNINVYASAAKGFRSGGFNAQGQAPYGPESVWTYDLGTKMRLLQGRLSIDTDVYLSNYSDYDIIGFTAQNPVNITRNGGTARLKGINADIAWRPSEEWAAGFNGDYIDAKFRTITALNTSYHVGDPVPFVPEYLLTAFFERDFHYFGRPAFARLEYSQLGRSTQFQRNLHIFAFSPIVHLLNFNTGVQWNDNLRLSLYAENLTNDRGYLDPTGIQNLAPRERPRTGGIEFAVNFD